MPPARVAIVVHGDPRSSAPPPNLNRLQPILDALEASGLKTEPAIYADDAVDAVCQQLLAVDAALVWVDPITDGADRGALDDLLRDVAAAGAVVSAHPDVILKMGTKEVLYTTRELGWGVDTHLYLTAHDFACEFPPRLAKEGPRVLKQYRGNGGQGVWKVEAVGQGIVRVQHAQVREANSEELLLDEFVSRCRHYFHANGGAGRLIDQPFQPRIVDGLIRCYFAQDKVVGFARQYALGRSPAELESGTAPLPASRVFGLPSAKIMYPPQEPAFESLRRQAEVEWLPAMQRLLAIDTRVLPFLWDADFLFGPRTPQGDDTYVLGEINVSCVIPFPPQAPAAIADTLAAQLTGVTTLAF